MFLNFKLKIFWFSSSIGRASSFITENYQVEPMLPIKDNTFLCLNLILYTYSVSSFFGFIRVLLILFFRVKFFIWYSFQVLKMRQNYSLRIQKKEKEANKSMMF
jgi:hypothetical protein